MGGNWNKVHRPRCRGGTQSGRTFGRALADALSMLRSEVEARELSGPVLTLDKMTPEQRARLERELGAPIRRRTGDAAGNPSKGTR